MSGSKFFFIESKTFEISVDNEGGASTVRIYEKGKDRIRSIHIGKENAKRLVINMVKLDSKDAMETFVCTIRKGDTVFLVQRCSNRRGRYISMQEIHKGG